MSASFLFVPRNLRKDKGHLSLSVALKAILGLLVDYFKHEICKGGQNNTSAFSFSMKRQRGMLLKTFFHFTSYVTNVKTPIYMFYEPKCNKIFADTLTYC